MSSRRGGIALPDVSSDASSAVTAAARWAQPTVTPLEEEVDEPQANDAAGVQPRRNSPPRREDTRRQNPTSQQPPPGHDAAAGQEEQQQTDSTSRRQTTAARGTPADSVRQTAGRQRRVQRLPHHPIAPHHHLRGSGRRNNNAPSFPRVGAPVRADAREQRRGGSGRAGNGGAPRPDVLLEDVRSTFVNPQRAGSNAGPRLDQQIANRLAELLARNFRAAGGAAGQNAAPLLDVNEFLRVGFIPRVGGTGAGLDPRGFLVGGTGAGAPSAERGGGSPRPPKAAAFPGLLATVLDAGCLSATVQALRHVVQHKNFESAKTFSKKASFLSCPRLIYADRGNLTTPLGRAIEEGGKERMCESLFEVLDAVMAEESFYVPEVFTGEDSGTPERWTLAEVVQKTSASSSASSASAVLPNTTKKLVYRRTNNSSDHSSTTTIFIPNKLGGCRGETAIAPCCGMNNTASREAGSSVTTEPPFDVHIHRVPNGRCIPVQSPCHHVFRSDAQSCRMHRSVLSDLRSVISDAQES